MSDQLDRLKAALSDHYAIKRQLGEGGMATVYLAHDIKHDRKVAVKLLRPELSAILGGERFLHEIKVTGNLQHPNILPLYDSGEAYGPDKSGPYLYYVMPLVEGDTLRDKLNREKQLGVDETVEIAKSVAAALDYAHRHDVIHRDIKPENILIQDGQALVADFGIALAVSQAGGTRLTETGLSLGTPHYMSPEQATGDRELDARSDVYSLGAMVYEMLVGEPPHLGNSVQAIIAKILSSEPEPVTAQRATIPPNVDAAVHKALNKTPADRFTSAAEFADALTNPAFALPNTQVAPALETPSGSLWNRLTIGFAASFVLMTAVVAWSLLRPEPPQPILRYSMALPAGQGIISFFAGIALSPDGSRLVYTGENEAGQAQLWVRRRDQLQATLLTGTQGALSPFFSPDGESVGFASGGLKVVSLRGGPPLLVTDSLVGGAGGSWGRDGFIYADGAAASPLVRVRATGGSPEWFTHLDSASGERDHLFPEVLPNGKGVLFRVGYGSSPDQLNIAVADITTGDHKVLVRGVFARYAQSGHLLYVTVDGTLMAVPFDQDALTTSGDPTAIVAGVALRILRTPDLAVSASGTLMYTTGGGVAGGGEPVWVDRDGKAEVIAPGWTNAAINLALSPDGNQLGVAISGSQEIQLWVRQLDRGTASKLTFQGQQNERPEWTPDGRSIAFITDRQGDVDLFQRRADGTAVAEVLLDMEQALQELRFTRDGSWLVYRQGGGPASDLYARRVGMDSAAIPLVATEFQETSPAVSPDGRWLAYVSNETGGSEVYVRPFPNVDDGRWLVSTDGGTEPMWAHSGRELFYRNGRNEMVAVEVLESAPFATGEQHVLFSAQPYRGEVFHQMYDVTPDDRRFVMIRIEETGDSDIELIVVENFFEELKAKVGR